ncbi:GMP/IMP nucleotidase [Parahaliea mediterranea]|uniref:GMP/IMP nucleotidase n=1 Tax=Parahaliea mediterranea TaxID=651086 RepID=A0A939DCE9_9GAMM|nr:GMP/IMP nucleotidase [Parahaliea mediterranea]MBN7795474.1 GMP/IMP nucleotidase [Parahaliea mediterranea]
MINWDSIDTVLLDMDGTLLDLHFDNFFWMEHVPREYARRNNIPEQEASEALLARISDNTGTLDWYSLDYWTAQLDMDLPALKRELRHMVSLRPHALDFLKALREGPRDVVMVTNAHRKTLDIKMEQVDITDWFHRIVVSHELRAPKEEQAFWHALQALHPFDPSRTLLIDDTESVLDSAHTYGIAHLLTLLQPDSQRQKRIDTRFPGIHHFDEIMPGAPRRMAT